MRLVKMRLQVCLLRLCECMCVGLLPRFELLGIHVDDFAIPFESALHAFEDFGSGTFAEAGDVGDHSHCASAAGVCDVDAVGVVGEPDVTGGVAAHV